MGFLCYYYILVIIKCTCKINIKLFMLNKLKLLAAFNCMLRRLTILLYLCISISLLIKS